MSLQIGPTGGIFENPIIGALLFYLPILVLMLYGQKINAFMILHDVGRSLNRLKVMKDRARKESVDYFSQLSKTKTDPSAKVDQFLEYFTIMPVELDPTGIIRKLEHVLTVRDERIKAEVKSMIPEADAVQRSTVESMLEAASALNLIFKIVRHFYLLGKKTTSLFVLIQLQMIMPLIFQEAEALTSAVDAFKNTQPIGDGIGPMVVGGMMLGQEKRNIAKETVYSEFEHKGRRLYLLKAEGPMGTVGQVGTAIDKMIAGMGANFNAIIMIDAALKLEGEKTGEIAEGTGAAIGGIGVDRFKIEEVAAKNNIPVYAIVIKQSIADAISVMKKEIAESAEKVTSTVYRLIEERTNERDFVLIVGVGNTLAVAQ